MLNVVWLVSGECCACIDVQMLKTVNVQINRSKKNANIDDQQKNRELLDIFLISIFLTNFNMSPEL